jgi:NAD(P)-dependent dehydrogenase (short-subunit alcohol dehydrogenase family)
VIDPGLTGRRALVAGGASGIGRAIAVGLEEQGVAVAVVDRDEPGVGAARIRIALGEPAASVEAVARAADALGGLDLVVYTAAVARHQRALELTPEAWEETMASNLAGCAWTCREAGRLLVAGGGGAILVVGSTSLYTPAAGESVYRASKAALKAFVEVLALELAASSVRVNLLTPGAVDTPLTAGMTDSELDAVLREVPLGRQAVPAELTATALLLLSDALSPYTTGAEFVVDGGIRLRPMPSLRYARGRSAKR